jgi:endo-1,4-beta-D-glucanase Y
MLVSLEELNNELLLSKTSCEYSAWHVAAFMDSSVVFEQLCGWAKEKLKTGKLNNNLFLANHERERTVLNDSTLLGNKQILERLWNWA